MQSDPQPAANPKWMTVAGWIITALPALFLIASGVVKLMNLVPPENALNIGWSPTALLGLGIVEVGSALLFLTPRTAFLGAILLTGYLGGAVATHVRLGEMFLIEMFIGALVWLGLFFRDRRLRALLPWRDSSVPAAGGFLAGLAKTALTLAVLLGVAVALVVALPGEFRITRSATIDAPPAKVFEQVNDFHKWEAWSPWAKLDPAARNSFEGPSAGTGAIFKWAGNDNVGEGSMTITESKPGVRVKLKLAFVRPFQDTNDVEFTFLALGDQTVVTWTMTGDLNLIGKVVCMVFNMETMVGGEYKKGLANMKKVVEEKK